MKDLGEVKTAEFNVFAFALNAVGISRCGDLFGIYQCQERFLALEANEVSLHKVYVPVFIRVLVRHGCRMHAVYANDRTRVDGEFEGRGGWAPGLSMPLALPAGVPHRFSNRSVVLGVATG